MTDKPKKIDALFADLKIGTGATCYVGQFREQRAHTVQIVDCETGTLTTTPDTFVTMLGDEDRVRFYDERDMSRKKRVWGHAEIRGERLALFPLDSKPGDRTTCDMLIVGYRSICYEDPSRTY